MREYTAVKFDNYTEAIMFCLGINSKEGICTAITTDTTDISNDNTYAIAPGADDILAIYAKAAGKGTCIIRLPKDQEVDMVA